MRWLHAFQVYTSCSQILTSSVNLSPSPRSARCFSFDCYSRKPHPMHTHAPRPVVSVKIVHALVLCLPRISLHRIGLKHPDSVHGYQDPLSHHNDNHAPPPWSLSPLNHTHGPRASPWPRTTFPVPALVYHAWCFQPKMLGSRVGYPAYSYPLSLPLPSLFPNTDANRHASPRGRLWECWSRWLYRWLHRNLQRGLLRPWVLHRGGSDRLLPCIGDAW